MSRPTIMTSVDKKTQSEPSKIIPTKSTQSPNSNKLTNAALNNLESNNDKAAIPAQIVKNRSATFGANTANTTKPTITHTPVKNATFAPSKPVVIRRETPAKVLASLQKNTPTITPSNSNNVSSNNTNNNQTEVKPLKNDVEVKKFEESFKTYEKEMLSHYPASEQSEIRQSLQIQKEDMLSQIQKGLYKIEKVKQEMEDAETKVNVKLALTHYRQRSLLEYHILKNNALELQDCLKTFKFDLNSLDENNQTLSEFAEHDRKLTELLLKQQCDKAVSIDEKKASAEKLNAFTQGRSAIKAVLEGHSINPAIANSQKKLGKLNSKIKECSEHLAKIEKEIVTIEATRNRKLATAETRIARHENTLLNRLQGQKRENARKSFMIKKDELMQQLTINSEELKKLLEEKTQKDFELETIKEKIKQKEKIVNYKQMEILQHHVIKGDLTIDEFVNYLHIFGFDPNATNEKGQTLLLIALDKDLSDIDEKLVQYLTKTVNGTIQAEDKMDATRFFLTKSPLIKEPKAKGPLVDKYNRIFTFITDNREKMGTLSADVARATSDKVGFLVHDLRIELLKADSLTYELEKKLIKLIKNKIDKEISGLSNQLLETARLNQELRLRDEQKKITEKLEKLFEEHNDQKISEKELNDILPARIEIQTEIHTIKLTLNTASNSNVKHTNANNAKIQGNVKSETNRDSKDNNNDNQDSPTKKRSGSHGRLFSDARKNSITKLKNFLSKSSEITPKPPV